MERIVLKLDGIALNGGDSAAAAIEDILDACDDPLVVVVPAFEGVVDILDAAVGRRRKRMAPEAAADLLRAGHLAVAEALDAPAAALFAASLRIEALIRRLLALLSADALPARADILAIGARLSATCVALALAGLGRPAPIIEPKKLCLLPALDRFPGAVVPGAYGDLSRTAAIVASALGARLLDAEEARSFARSRFVFTPFAHSRARIAQKPGVA
jgi:hypothetical protein